MTAKDESGKVLEPGGRRPWLLPGFFTVWTLFAAGIVWFLLTRGGLEPGQVLTFESGDGRPLAARLREWLELALVNFHWAAGWILLGPYAFWVASRFCLDKQHWLARAVVLAFSGAAFVVACDALGRRLGGVHDVMILVTSRTVSVGDRSGEPWRTNHVVFREKVISALRSNAPDPEFLQRSMPTEIPWPGAFLKEDETFTDKPGSTNELRYSRRVRSGPRRAPVYRVMDSAAWLALAGLAHAFQFHRRYRERERQAALLSATLAEAQLRALRNQLQPHFLFNALNGIATLVRRDARAAHEMLTSLSELLRLALSQADRQVVSLREELELLDRYLDIQRMRFGDKLDISRDIEGGTLEGAVPPLVLQPLVENAILHGIEPTGQPGRIRIMARRRGKDLLLVVEDNGVGLGTSGERMAGDRPGVGLANIRERLASLYGSEADLRLDGAPGAGAKAEVRLPFRTVSSDLGRTSTS